MSYSVALSRGDVVQALNLGVGHRYLRLKLPQLGATAAQLERLSGQEGYSHCMLNVVGLKVDVCWVIGTLSLAAPVAWCHCCSA